MATRTRDVAESVHEVVAAFDQAINYVRRIEERKDGKEDAEAIHDLYKSLALGPTIVQGYFDADSKRLGPSYLLGDATAQFQLRDVLLSLRTLVSDLQSALLDGKELNYKELQHASDTCRVNAGVWLGQLSQRLTEESDHLRMPQQSSPAYMSGYPSPGSGLDYSSSRSTHSSVRERLPRTPDPFYAQQQSLTPYWQLKQAESSEQYRTPHRRQDTEISIQESYTDWLDTSSQAFVERDPEQLSMRRPSSHTLAPEDGALLSPALPPESPQALLPGQLDIVRDSYTSFTSSTEYQPQRGESVSNVQPERLHRDRYGPDDFSPVESHSRRPFYPEQTEARQSATSYANRAFDSSQHGGLELVSPESMQQPSYQQFRLPHRPARADSLDSQGRPVRKPIAQYPSSPPSAFNNQYNARVNIPYPTDPQQPLTKTVSLQPRSQSQSSVSASLQPSTSPSNVGSPYLPSEAVQRAMARTLARQNSIDNTLKQNSTANFGQSTPQQYSNNFVSMTSRTSPQAVPSNFPQPLFPPPAPIQQTETPLAMPSVQQPHQSLPHRRSQQQLYEQQQQIRHAHMQLRQQQLQEQHQQQTTVPPPQLPLVQTPSYPSQPQQQPSQQQLQLQRPATKGPSITSIPLPQNIPLNLPTDKNTHPFCKGAFRLLIGLTKKAFIDSVRPIGYTSTLSYWRCDKCFFEGPMFTIPGPPDKKGRPGKGEKVFDPTVRECGPLSTAVVGADGRGEGSGGIRYKWAFLAKCHVPQKSIPIGQQTEIVGGFGCLFCAAEGQARGWTGPNGTLTGAHTFGSANDAASTFSGKSGHSSSGGGANTSGATPIFGNVRTFMDHLQLHRREEAWPCTEMQGRMKCIVGRTAERGEDFEINFLPV